jgi:hypothetical protein
MKPERRCRTCEYGTHRNEQAKIVVCTRWPPHPFIVGMGQAAVVDPKKAAPIPIIRGYFPVVGYEDGCGEYEMATEGEA